MAIFITVAVICDNCGIALEPAKEVNQSEIDAIRWAAQRKFCSVKRPMRKTRMFCGRCADKPMPKFP